MSDDAWETETTQCTAIADSSGERCNAKAPAGHQECWNHRVGGGWKPTDQERKLVEVMAMVGGRQKDIAEVLDVSGPTLRKHCREALDKGQAYANAKVASTAFRMATSGKSATMTIFWLKTRMGWTPKHQVDHTSGGEKIDTVVYVPDDGRDRDE